MHTKASDVQNLFLELQRSVSRVTLAHHSGLARGPSASWGGSHLPRGGGKSLPPFLPLVQALGLP